MRQRHAAVLGMIALFVVGVFSLVPRAGQAQSSDSSCPALVELALSQVGNNCGDLPRNSACYGFNRVDSNFTQAVSEGFFSRPADKAELVNMKSIQTAPLDLGLGQWGIAVLNVQANVPDTLPGQAVTFLLMGDTQVENAPPSEAGGQQPPQPVTVITQTETDLRSGVEAGSAIVSTLAAGTVLQAEAISDDGLSIQVSTDSATGWIDRASVNTTPQISELSSAEQKQPSPMQAFYFRTGPGQTACSQTPSILAIQSPENIKVDLNANGADIRLGSLVTLQVLPGNIMKLTTLEGDALLNAGKPDEVDVPAGFTTQRCLTDPQNLGQDGQANDQKVGDNCAWDAPKPAGVDDLDQGQIVQATFERLGLAREGLLPPTTPIPPEATETPAGAECPTGTTIDHVVAVGENLYRIGLRFNTSIGAIMQANHLTDPSLIFVGQKLIIPCGVDLGIPSLPNPPAGVFVPPTNTTGIDCNVFRGTLPLDGFNFGTNTIYWDALPGATGYRVNVYNLDEKGGALVASFDAAAGQTNLTADLSIQTVGYGFSFAWDVQALVNGAVVCTSGPFKIPRAPQPANTGPAGFSGSWGCVPGSQFSISWANVPPGTTLLVFKFAGSAAPPSPFRIANPPLSGSTSFLGLGAISAGSIQAMPSAASVPLSPASLGVCP